MIPSAKKMLQIPHLEVEAGKYSKKLENEFLDK